jgi:hypothetical protein
MNQTCYCCAQLLVVVSVEYIMQFNESTFFFLTNLRYILTGPAINEPPDAPFCNDRIDFSCYETSSSYRKTELWRCYIYI